MRWIMPPIIGPAAYRSTARCELPLYGNSVFDITHRGTISITYNIPGKKGHGQILEGWALNSVVTLQSGLPWGADDTGNDFSGTGEVGQTNEDGQGEQWNFFGNPKDFKSLHGFTSNPVNGDILSGGTGGVPFYAGSGDATIPALRPLMPRVTPKRRPWAQLPRPRLLLLVATLWVAQ